MEKLITVFNHLYFVHAMSNFIRFLSRNFPTCPLVKNPPSYVKDKMIPGQRTKNPHAVEQQRACILQLRPVACQVPLLWDSPGKNTRVGYHALLQGIFLTLPEPPQKTPTKTQQNQNQINKYINDSLLNY